MHDVSELIALLQDTDQAYYRRAEAARHLGESGEPGAIKPLIAALTDDEKYVRREVVLALGRFSIEETIEALTRALAEDDDDQTRRNVLRILAESGDRRALVAARGALEDASWGIRYEAKDAVRKLEASLPPEPEEPEEPEAPLPTPEAPSPPEAEDSSLLQTDAEPLQEEEVPAPAPSKDSESPARPDSDADELPVAAAMTLQLSKAEETAFQERLEAELEKGETVEHIAHSSLGPRGMPGESWLILTSKRIVLATQPADQGLSFQAYDLTTITGTVRETTKSESGHTIGVLLFVDAEAVLDGIAFLPEECLEFDAVDDVLAANSTQANATEPPPIPPAEPPPIPAKAKPPRKAHKDKNRIPDHAYTESMGTRSYAKRIEVRTDKRKYLAGDVVSGEVIAYIPAPLPVRGVRVGIRGAASCQIGAGKSSYSETNILLDDELTLLGEPRGSWIRNIEDAFVTIIGQGRHETLPRGIHHYPFRFKLPSRLPPTYTGEHARISYELRAYADIPAALDPAHKRTLCIGFPKAEVYGATLRKDVKKSGKTIQLNLALEHCDWRAKEALTGLVTLLNQTGKQIRAIDLTLVREEHSRAGSAQRTETKKICHATIPVTGKKLDEQPFSLSFPHGFPAFQSRLVSLSYYLKVQLDIAWGLDARFRIPLRFRQS